ncbi:MAG TPA: NAD-dependent epimerase/dehydratase family protein [Vicinamibacterales bacterium]|nr:NAD-dependent epimerase/dehydratase family protein [Vicinamibacterales bacterium]
MPGAVGPPSGYGGRTIAVTGAAGFLGGRLVSRLAAADCRIIRVARSAPPPLDLPQGATVIDVTGDAGDRGVWDRIADADVIFHFAAQTSAATAADDSDRDFQANVTPMHQLLTMCRERGRRPIVLFAGTVTEAGIPSRLPVDEDAPDDPITIYDRHKLMAEQDLKAAAVNGDVRGATLRLANVYGPGARGQRVDRDVLNRMIKTAIDGGALTVHGTGEYVRDYVFVEDVVDAFLMAAAQPDRVNGRHFVIGSGRGISIRDAFELIAARVELSTGRRVPVTTTDPGTRLSPIEQRHFVADPSRFSAATGWRPSWSLTEGIDRTIEAFRCG